MNLPSAAKEMHAVLVCEFYTIDKRSSLISLEFNILYRWHATLSDPDAKWIDNELTQMFQKPSSEVGRRSKDYQLPKTDFEFSAQHA